MKTYGGQSMVAPLKRVLLCPPECADWGVSAQSNRWHELGFSHPPDFARAEKEHAVLRHELEAAGVEIRDLSGAGDLTLDAVYAHDASFMTDQGAVCLRMGKPARAAEPEAHRRFYQSAGIPVFGEIEGPGSAEAGDIVWLDANTLLVGRGYRTNSSGIQSLRRLLAPQGVSVTAAPLPHGSGPDTCLHLMSLISLLDDHTALVDVPLLAVETVELLLSCDFRLAEIDPSERFSLACNVLALGNGRLLALEENRLTNSRLSRLGYEVRTFPGAELALNGGGGPTCLTRPLLRE